MATTKYELRTFDDIVDAIMEELKYQSSDTTSRNRIKRDVNTIYMNEVVPYEQWKWLRGYVSIPHEARYSTGTASLIQNSNSVTLSTGSAICRKGYLFSVEGQSEVYRIAQHTAAGTAITLDVPYIGSTNTAATFKIWTDRLPLPVELRDTVSVYLDTLDTPLEGQGIQQYRRHSVTYPKLEGRPRFYSTSDYVDPSPFSLISGLPLLSTAASDGLVKTLVFASTVAAYIQAGDRIEVSGAGLHYSFNGEWVVSSVSTTTITYTSMVSVAQAASADATLVIKKDNNEKGLERYKELWVYPSIYTSRCTLHVDYTKEVAPLVEDDDEPLMPIGDRTVLLYGALMKAWTRERNPEEAARCERLYERKLAKMAGKLDDSTDLPILRTGKTWLAAKRSSTRARASDFYRYGGSGSSSATTSSSDILGTPSTVAIYGADGVLVGSAFISTTELNFLNGLLSLAVGISDIQTLTNKTIDADANTLSNIENADIKAAAAIARSKIASGTISHVVINDGAGALSSEAALAKTRGGTGIDNSSVTFPSTGVIVTEAASETLTNKTITSPSIGGTVAGSATYTTPVLTTPTANGLKVAVTGSKTGTYSAAATDYLIPCNASGGGFTVNLPAASGNTGLTFLIKKTDSTLNIVTIDGNASETIDGSTTTTLNTQNESVLITCDGSNWLIQERCIPQIWTTYTPTVTGAGTISSSNTQWSRVGSSMKVRVFFNCGTASGSDATVSYPSGLTGATLLQTYIAAVGASSANQNLFNILIVNGETKFFMGLNNVAGGGLSTKAGTAVWSSGESVVFTAEVQIAGWNG
jgi:hypothetical protein